MDRPRFDTLVAELAPDVLALCIRLCGNVHDAEDIAQEALVRAARSHQSFRGDSSLKTWLFRLAINVFRDRLRQNRPDAIELDDAIEAASGSPSREVANRETAELVASAVSSLPRRQREVIALTVFEQLSTRETAEVLGISEQNVRTTAHEARKSLRQKLEHLLNDART